MGAFSPDDTSSKPDTFDIYGSGGLGDTSFKVTPPPPPEDQQTIIARQHDEGAGPKPGGSGTSANVNDFLAGFAQGNPDEVGSIQQQLEAAGFLRSGSYQLGYPDSERTLPALQQAILEAEQQNISLAELLRRRRGREKGAGGSGGRRSLAEMAQDEYRNSLLQAYFDVWGSPPPPGYIERAAASGMNIAEFTFYEKSKPSWRSTPQYQTQRVSLEAALAAKFGALG